MGGNECILPPEGCELLAASRELRPAKNHIRELRNESSPLTGPSDETPALANSLVSSQ